MLTRYVSQEARFDRHFCRDLTWSRHQLEELAERCAPIAPHYTPPDQATLQISKRACGVRCLHAA